MGQVWSEKQASFLEESDAAINLACGAVRSGKTTAAIARWIVHVATAPPGDLFGIGVTVGSLLRNVFLPLQRWVGQRRCRIKRSVGEVWLGDRGKERVVYLLGAGDSRAEDKIAGATSAGIIGDEVNLWPEGMFRVALERQSVDGAQFYGTLNPESPYHYLYKDFITRADEVGLKIWNFGLDDNPGLSERYKELIRAQHTGVWHLRRVLGQWVVAEGAVFDCWSEERHCVASLPRSDEGALLVEPGRFAGVDHGTANPFVAERVATGLGKWPAYFFDAEYYWSSKQRGRQLSDPEYCEALEGAWAEAWPSPWFIDPEAAAFIAAARGRGGQKGGRRWEAVGANNAIREGIACMATLLAEDRLKVVKSACPQLCASMGSLVWDPEAAKKGREVPLKVGDVDHPADAGRYALFSKLGPRPGRAVVTPALGPELLRMIGV